MTVLVDTHVVLDVLQKKEPHFSDSYAVLMQGTERKLELLFSATSVTDVHYVLRRAGLTGAAARAALQGLLTFVHVADVRSEDIQRALLSSLSDFEDAVAAEIACRHRCEAIITRNGKDYAGSAIPALSPEAFLKEG
jgi:predicted nucleic acid-binding protein